MASYVDRNLMAGEAVLYRAKVSAWALAPRLVIGVLLLISFGPILMSGVAPITIMFSVGLALLIWAWVTYSTTEFAVTDRRVIAKAGLVSRRTVEMFLDRVESLSVGQGIVGRLLNYGTITVVGTGATKEPFKSISAPLVLRKHFMNAVDAYRRAA